jgi:hypothetical protein
MISGTSFTIGDAAMVEAACHQIRAGIASPSEIAELKAQCEHGTALCVACEDGIVVFDVRYTEDDLEMFVWLAVAFRHGAFQRQESAMLNIARDLGAKTLAFQTRRKGWGRRLGPQWRRRGSLEFVRYVDERQ